MSTLSTLLHTPRPSDEQVLGLPETDTDGQTRLYRGRSIDELIPRIEAELGVDAIVVRRKRGLEGGIGGFFQRPYVEVEAKPGGPRIDVYDDVEPARPPAPPAGPAALHMPARPAAHMPQRTEAGAEQTPTPAVLRPRGAYVTDTLASIAAAGSTHESIVEDAPRPAASVQEFRELTPDTFGAALAEAASQPIPLESELEQLDRDMGEDAGELHVMRPRAHPAAQAPQPTTHPVAAPRWERARAGIQRSMTGLGVSEEFTRELIDSAAAHAIPFAPRIGLARAVHGALVARIPVNPLLPAQRATVAVVGPGGSGKTSCCAAVLGAYRRAGTLPASCASILLEPELQQPAMLLSPHIMEPTRLGAPHAREALAQARGEGLLLLDLPALSPADRGAIRMMASLLEELRPDRVVVALPATLGATAAAQLLEALSPLRAGALAITHADETDQLGVAVEAACKFGLAPEYLLDRGRVRGGLTRIDPTHLADRLLK
jgi:flagellar biosynthesis GTPase FlhF